MHEVLAEDSSPVVIVGLNDATLSIVRSLGRRGIRIVGVHDEKAKGYYLNSRYISMKFRSSLENESLIETLNDKVAGVLRKPGVLFCGTDGSVLCVSKHEASLRGAFRFVLPSYEIASEQISKKKFYDFAKKNSFLVPDTCFTQDYLQIQEASERISFPCIIKPEFRSGLWTERVPFKALFAETREMLFGLIRRYNIGEIPLIIQQWVDGGDSEVHFVLAYISRDHEPLGVCMGRKLRQYPPLTGSTSVAETISIPEIEEAALRLLLKAKCVGFCSVEFKKSKRDGEFYITEPTIGRPDTQEGICIAADSDFSLIAYLDAIGGKVEKKGKFRSGIRWINEPLEFYCLQQLWGGGSSIREFFSIYGGKRSYSVWAGDDLRPVVAFVKEKIAKGFRRLC